MRKKTTKIIALAIALLFLLGILSSLLDPSVYAAPKDKKLQEYEEQEKSVWQEMQNIEKEINRLGEEIYQLDEAIKVSEEALLQSEKELEVAEEMETAQRGKFRERFTVLCERGTASYLEMIFSAESFSDLIEKLVIVREMAEYDRNILAAMEEVKNQIRIQKETQEQLLLEQEQAKSDLEKTEAELYQKSAAAAERHASLQADKAAYEKYLAEKEAAENATKAQAGISGGTGTVASGRISSGYFTWPTNTWYITSAFSPNRVNPVTGVLRAHTGTDIGALQGAPVWAAQSGTVVLAEYNGGYGNCVIIDHGGGVKTLYGHMSAILVKQGDRVGNGAQIGRVGSTGNSTGPHLHFEVLVDGAAVDPMQFF